MHAFLIISNDPKQQKTESQRILQEKNIQPNSIESMIISPMDQTIKIEQIRAIGPWISTNSPSQRALLIHEADKMTIPAQNALLKTLEEPDKNTTIILTAQSESTIIPTIKSRCRIIRKTMGEKAPSTAELYTKLITINSATPPYQKLQHGYDEIRRFLDQKATSQQPTINREQAKEFIESIVASVRKYDDVNGKKAKHCAHLLRLAIDAYQRLQANVNPLATLEQFFLEL